jgi:hypothetical protein
LWLQLKTYINMCSCSGNCNCNSTTIPRGPAGPQGPSGSISVGEVTSLPFGSEPTVTNSGTTSSAIFNFGIPEGEQGIQGETGEQGVQGIPGVNGITRLFSSTTGFSSPSAGSGTLLLSAPIPANTLNADGKALKITMYWRNAFVSATPNETALGITFDSDNTCVGSGSGLIYLYTSNVVPFSGVYTLEIIRTGGTTAVAYTSVSNTDTVNGNAYTEKLNLLGLDFTAINNLSVNFAQSTGFDAEVTGFFVDLILP